MMQIRAFRGVLLGLAALIILPAVPATASFTTDLLTLKISAQVRLTGGSLDRKQVKAVEALLKKIERVEETDVELQASKYVARVAKVVQAVEKAEAKEVDLGEGATSLLASLVAQTAAYDQAAVMARDLLQVEKDAKVVDRKVSRGREQVTDAAGQPTDTKRAKKYASAARTFLQAVAQGTKLLEKEIRKGIVNFEITGTSLDSNPVLDPAGTIVIEFSLLASIDSLTDQTVRVTQRRPSHPEGPGETYATTVEPGDGPTEVIARTDVPLPGGTWYFIVAGLDSEYADGARSADYPITLAKTLVIEFTVVE